LLLFERSVGLLIVNAARARRPMTFGRSSDERDAARVAMGRIDPARPGAWLALQRSRDLRSRTAEYLVPHLGLCRARERGAQGQRLRPQVDWPAIRHHDPRRA